MIIHVLPDVGGNYTQYFFLRHEGTTPNTFCHLDVGEIYTREGHQTLFVIST